MGQTPAAGTTEIHSRHAWLLIAASRLIEYRAMVTHRICPKCQHNHILLITNVPDTGEVPSDIRALHVAVVLQGVDPAGQREFGSAGRLGAAVCRQCGYTELYTNNAGEIPIDGTYVREVVGPEPKDA